MQPFIVPPFFEGFVSIIKKLQHNFPKMRGGSKAAWNFSENSSVLETPSVPKKDDSRVPLQVVLRRLEICSTTGGITYIRNLIHVFHHSLWYYTNKKGN